MIGPENAREVARRLDLDRSGRGWRGACPSCGYGSTTLVLSDKGSLWCANCGRDGPAEELARRQGGEQPQAAERQPGKAERTPAERTERALRWWNGAPQGALGTPADAYLTGRGLPGLAASPAIRYRTDVSHPEERSRVPAMLALVQDVTGAPIAVHRTYITRGGRKADVVPVKASVGPIFGGAIRLDPVAPELVVGEGIETSASAGRLLGLPAWAAIAAGNLAQALRLPAEVRRVVIAVDPDAAGQRAAQAASDRWQREGRRVRFATPDTPGADFNDMLMRGAPDA